MHEKVASMQARVSGGNALRSRILVAVTILLALTASLLFRWTEEPKITIPDRLELARMLRDGEFARLDQLMNQIQDAYESGNFDEGALRSVVLAFHRADPDFAERLSDWRAAFPKSFAPDVAIGSYNLAVAWTIRGTELGRYTSAKQFELMQDFLAKSYVSYRAAVKKRPRTSIAWADLISVAMGSGGGRYAIDKVYVQAASILPNSSIIHHRYHYALAPKWYGSKSEQLELRKELIRQFSKNQNFDWAKFAEDDDKEWDKAWAFLKEKRGVDALVLAERLVQRSDTYLNRLNRGHIFYNLKMYDKALDEYFLILRIWPSSREPVKHIQHIMTRQRRRLAALEYWRKLVRHDPYNPEILLPYASFLAHLEMNGDSQKALDRALIYGAHNDKVHVAIGRRFLEKKQMARAIVRMRRAVQLVPARAINWLSLARTLKMDEDCAAVEPYKTYLEICRSTKECNVNNVGIARISVQSLIDGCD